MRKIKKITALFLVLLAVTFVLPVGAGRITVEAANLNYSKVVMMQGATFELKLQGTSGTVKWSSSKKKIATVKNGKVTALMPGTCTITAKVGSEKCKCTIEVKKNPNYVPKKKAFKEVTLNVLELKLDVNKVTYTQEGKMKLGDDSGTYKLRLLNTSKKAKWKTSNLKVAKVKNGVITAVGKGKCTIKAVVGKKSYSCKVVITNLKKAKKIAVQENIYQMLGLMNNDRVKKAKSAPLKIKDKLNKVAEIRANEGKKYFSHTRPNGSSYKTAFTEAGVKIGSIVGENLAFTSDKVEYMDNFINVAYKMLYNSKTHRANILDGKYEYVGIDYTEIETYIDENGVLCAATYWAQEFYTK